MRRFHSYDRSSQPGSEPVLCIVASQPELPAHLTSLRQRQQYPASFVRLLSCGWAGGPTHPLIPVKNTPTSLNKTVFLTRWASSVEGKRSVVDSNRSSAARDTWLNEQPPWTYRLSSFLDTWPYFGAEILHKSDGAAAHSSRDELAVGLNAFFILRDFVARSCPRQVS